MVIGEYVKCITCGHTYRIRYNKGNTFPQQAMFKCKSCGTNIEFGFDKEGKGVWKNIESIKESKDSTTQNLTIQNLHPELPIDPSRESDPSYFPSPIYMVKHLSKNKNYDEFRSV